MRVNTRYINPTKGMYLSSHDITSKLNIILIKRYSSTRVNFTALYKHTITKTTSTYISANKTLIIVALITIIAYRTIFFFCFFFFCCCSFFLFFFFWFSLFRFFFFFIFFWLLLFAATNVCSSNSGIMATASSVCWLARQGPTLSVFRFSGYIKGREAVMAMRNLC